jgi:hypothetical protein
MSNPLTRDSDPEGGVGRTLTSEEGLLEKQVMSVIDLRSNVTSRWRTGSPLLFESYQSE